MAQPSIGRIVHYVSYGTPGGEYKQECRAAIITQVHSGPVPEHGVPYVGLAVINPTGMFFREEVLYDAGDLADHPGENGAPTVPSYRGGTWHWPEITKEA